MSFNGFPEETTRFLEDLRDNNRKDWFDANRERYEDFWLEPARSFVVTAGEALRELAPAVVADPKINGSIRRINRDTRFSKDKTPYKDHLDIGFWEGEGRSMLSGFWVRLTPDAVGVGVGAHGFDKDRLSRFRQAVVDPDLGKRLERAVADVEEAGWEVRGEHYKRVPPGFDAADAFQERLLRFAALWTGEDLGHPAELGSAGIIDWLLERWRRQLPLHRWLVEDLE